MVQPRRTCERTMNEPDPVVSPVARLSAGVSDQDAGHLSPFAELSRGERRRVLAALVLRTTISVAMLLAIYALVPVGPTTFTDAAVRLAGVLGFVVLLIAMQVHAIRTANYPVLRATEAVIDSIAAFIIAFSLLYLNLSQAEPANFSEPLGRVSAFYFTVTMLSTVGFGDIAAKTDLARIVATVQMLLDLAIIAIIVRVFGFVARANRAR